MAGGGEEEPHYLHSAHKELYPPGRLLWMVVEEPCALPPHLRDRVLALQRRTPGAEGAAPRRDTANAAAAAAGPVPCGADSPMGHEGAEESSPVSCGDGGGGADPGEGCGAAGLSGGTLLDLALVSDLLTGIGPPPQPATAALPAAQRPTQQVRGREGRAAAAERRDGAPGPTPQPACLASGAKRLRGSSDGTQALHSPGILQPAATMEVDADDGGAAASGKGLPGSSAEGTPAGDTAAGQGQPTNTPGPDGSGGGGPLPVWVLQAGFKRLKSGVETMLRQAPALPSVPGGFFGGAEQRGAQESSTGGGASSSQEGRSSSDSAEDEVDGSGEQWLFLVEADRDVFERMALIPSCVTDHLPDVYFQHLRQLAQGNCVPKTL